MESKFSHVLVFTARLTDANKSSVGVVDYEDPAEDEDNTGMIYDYSTYLQADESLIDPRITKVFHYSDIFLCHVLMDDEFAALGSPEARTESLKPLVASLFTNADSVSFEWMLRQKEDVEPIIERAIGSSGGASIGSRGG